MTKFDVNAHKEESFKMKAVDEVYPKEMQNKRHSYPSVVIAETLKNSFVLPAIFNDDVAEKWEDTMYENINKTYLAVDDIESRAHIRRHSWSFASRPKEGALSVFSSSNQNSRRSSATSIAEIIEECPSDDEEDVDNSNNDYMQCINCSMNNSNGPLDNNNNNNNNKNSKNIHTNKDKNNRNKSEKENNSQMMSSCYRCRHLINKTLLLTPIFNDYRRSSLTLSSDGSACSSPRRSRRSSLTDGIDLPVISEPSFDDDTNDTKELKMLVEQEVHKLLGFSRTPERRASEDSTCNS